MLAPCKQRRYVCVYVCMYIYMYMYVCISYIYIYICMYVYIAGKHPKMIPMEYISVTHINKHIHTYVRIAG